MDSQRPASVDEEVAALSRGADRDSLFMQAQLALPGGGEPVTVRVRNLSPGGMLAEGKVVVAQGAVVEVDLRNIGPVTGRVIWVGDGKFGIAFDRAIDPQSVRRQVVSQSDLPPHLRRTGLERGPLYRRR
ncbi:Type IV pilus assembly PilZ [uncultured Sphingopyxis sp.]|uniref:Type IV pilus assembly PilZ n=1 Tax=uncultured Sphingopyxis sp. TaxID=310581 RepID=A0A1Y5Q1H0_9SPHN|nr:PilZ domain-containing protein [uncultured Sphingopyxis sp.]SBV33617.1 Type IV pilus assembly PilZ [uncultured Sphingopyxis sp.]